MSDQNPQCPLCSGAMKNVAAVEFCRYRDHEDWIEKTTQPRQAE